MDMIIKNLNKFSKFPNLFIGLIFIFLFFLNVLFYFQANPVSSFIMNSLALIPPVLTAILLYCSAYSLGDYFILKLRFNPPQILKFFVTELLGLQVLIYFILCLGFCHILIPGVFWFFILLTSLFAFKKLFYNLKAIKERLLFQWDCSEMLFLSLLVILLLILMANGYSPFSWYDSLVYHMAVPQHYLEAQKIFLIEGNVYSNFPLNAEILFLGSLLLGNELGVKFLILGQVVFTLSLCAVFLKDFNTNKVIPLIAVIIIGSNIQIFTQIIQGNIDIFVAFSFTVYLLHIFYSPFDRFSDFVLNGILGGILMGFKYQTGPFFIIPGIIFLSLKVISSKKQFSFLFLVPLISLITFSPWLIKNALLTGNPLYPFFYNFFDITELAEIHWPQFIKIHQSLSYDLCQLGYSFFSSLDGFLTLLVIVNMINKQGLMLGILLPIPLWGILSKGDIRYILPIFPLLLSSAISNLSTLQNTKLFSFFKLIFLIFILIRIHSLILLNPDIAQYAAGIKKVSEKSATFTDPYFRAIPYLNSYISKDSCILMIGEARSYGCKFKTVTATLFDKNPIEGILMKSKTIKEMINQLKARGFTHVLLNKSELARLQAAYGNYFPVLAGYSFKKDSRELKLFSEFMNLITQNNLIPQKITDFFFLYRL